MKQTGRIPSKWEKTKRLNKDALVKDHVPETTLFNKKNLAYMLDKYKVVYIKPSRGTGGRRVVRIDKKFEANNAVYSYHYKEKLRNFNSIDTLYKSLKKITEGKKRKRSKFIIQKGIPLLKYDRRIFDLRLMVQRNQENEVEVTGILGRVAKANKIVTNYHAGGTLFSFEQLFSSYMTEQEIKDYKKKLYKIGEQIGEIYDDVKGIGVDIGIDENFYPWIIELNFKPYLYGFKLVDEEMYKNIMKNRRFHRRKE